MIKKTLLLLLTGLSILSAKGDTISHWHVYYNSELLGKFNEVNKLCHITIKKYRIKETDSLTIKFAACTDCSDCKISLFINDVNGNTLKTINSVGERTPLVISLKELLALGDESKIKQYEFILYKYVLFNLKIE